jgi:hypothetical protein
MPWCARFSKLCFSFEAICERGKPHSGFVGFARLQVLAVISALQANTGHQVDKCDHLKCSQALSHYEFAVWNSDFPMHMYNRPVESRSFLCRCRGLRESSRRAATTLTRCLAPRAKVWDDETGIKKSKCSELLWTSEYEAVVGILRNISSIRKRNPKNRKLVRSRRIHDTQALWFAGRALREGAPRPRGGRDGNLDQRK